MTRARAGAAAPPPAAPAADGPRTYARYLAVCDALIPTGETLNGPCPFNDRPEPTLHGRRASARREAAVHALDHVGVREVQAERIVTARYRAIGP